MFQDIDGDVGCTYARVSFHPTGSHCEVADSLNVEDHRDRYYHQKDAGYHEAREAVSSVWGWATHCVQPACKSTYLQKGTRYVIVCV